MRANASWVAGGRSCRTAGRSSGTPESDSADRASQSAGLGIARKGESLTAWGEEPAGAPLDAAAAVLATLAPAGAGAEAISAGVPGVAKAGSKAGVASRGVEVTGAMPRASMY